MAVVHVGCGTRALSPEEYMGWVQEEKNGLVQTKQSGDYQFTLFYKPYDYVIASELDNISMLDNDKYRTLQEEIKGMEYFTFKISFKGQKSILDAAGNIEQRDELNNYFDYKIQNDFKMIINGDTVGCQLSHFEKSRGIVPYSTFVLGFSKQREPDESISFIYDDQLFGTGPIVFDFNNNIISTLPELKLS